MFYDLGNQGNDATEFVKLYNPRYIILEPLEEYYNILKNKFENNPRFVLLLCTNSCDDVEFILKNASIYICW